MKNFETIAVFQYPAEYAVLQLLLDQEEIRYRFLDQTTIGIFPFYSNAMGGIRLQVHKEDVQKARKIIERLEPPSHLKII